MLSAPLPGEIRGVGMKIRLRLLGMLRFLSLFKDHEETEVDFSGDTVEDLVKHLVSKIESKEKPLFLDEQGEMSPELLIFLNEKPILASDRFSQALCEGDLLELALDSG